MYADPGRSQSSCVEDVAEPGEYRAVRATIAGLEAGSNSTSWLRKSQQSCALLRSNLLGSHFEFIRPCGEHDGKSR